MRFSLRLLQSISHVLIVTALAALQPANAMVRSSESIPQSRQVEIQQWGMLQALFSYVERMQLSMLSAQRSRSHFCHMRYLGQSTGMSNEVRYQSIPICLLCRNPWC